MKFLRKTGQRFIIAGELFSFFWSNERRLMLPMLIMLFVFAVLLVLAQSAILAPFTYPFF